MELKPGYKQTEVGGIPEDWDVLPVGDLQPFVTSGSRGWAAFYSDYGALFLRITNLVRGSIYLDLNDLRFVSLPTINSEGARTQLQDGDVLISITADIGIIGYVSGNVPRPAYINQHIALVRFDSSKINPQFVSYFLASEKPQKLFRALTDSGAKAGINLTTIKQVRLALPPTLAEQEAIAGALSDADALIESLENLIAKKRHLKQGAMQQLLTGKKRLPGFIGAWEVKRLGDVCYMKSGEGITSADIDEYSEFPCYGGNGLRGFSKRYTHDGSYALIGRQGALCGNVLIVDGRFFASEHAIIVTPQKETDISWLSCVLARMNLNQYSESSAQPGLSVAKLLALECIVPPLPEQTAIATILSDMDAEIAALEVKLIKARQIKQGMMHNLLIGTVRLVKPSIAKGEQHVPVSGDTAARKKTGKLHNWAINEAVVISMLADRFGQPDFPLGRKRYTKLSYLLHRKAEREAQGYLKKAAGPYNPKTKYAGPEKIAQENGYVRYHDTGRYKGFIAAENIEQAKAYFAKWYGGEIAAWLEQFRRSSNDDLERLATVDMTMQELHRQGKTVDVAGVRALIASEPEWLPKLERTVFSDAGIAAAITECHALFGS